MKSFFFSFGELLYAEYISGRARPAKNFAIFFKLKFWNFPLNQLQNYCIYLYDLLLFMNNLLITKMFIFILERNYSNIYPQYDGFLVRQTEITHKHFFRKKSVSVYIICCYKSLNEQTIFFSVLAEMPKMHFSFYKLL